MARLAAAVGRAAGVEDLEAVAASSSCSGMCEWPKTTAAQSGNAARRRSSRPVAGPASWTMPDARAAGLDDARRGQAPAQLGLVDVAVHRGDRRAERLELVEDRRRA